MGIYFNHKLLVPDPNGSEAEKLYYNGQQKIRELFKEHHGAIVLKRDHDLVWDIKRKSYRPVVPFSLPVEAHVSLPSLGKVAVRYSKSAPVLVDKQYVYTGNRIFVYEKLHLREEDIDLAWFIVMASDFVELLKEDGTPVKRGGSQFLRIDNPEVEIKKQAKENKLIARLDRYIYFDDSPIYNMEAARHLANQFGIELDANTIDVAMHQIRSAVLAGDKSKNPTINIDRFIEYCGGLARVEYPSEWDGVVPEDGFHQLQLQALGYNDLKAIAKELELELGAAPKKSKLIEEILKKVPAKV